MGLRLLKKTGILILDAAVLMSAMSTMEVLAAKPYPFIYDNSCAQTDDYMALTEAIEDYIVLPGDSLWKIAEKQFGNGNYYLDLIDTNQDILTDPDLIYPGMSLKIARTAYIQKDERSLGGIQMDKYAMDMPYGWTIGMTQSGNAGGNFVMSGDGEIACLVQDRTKEISEDVFDWQECTQQISTYVEENYNRHVSDLHFEHYRMDGQEDMSGELYLYSYIWHISPDDYPGLACKVCVGLKLTEHIQAEFVGYTYTLDDYDIESCVRYVTASFEEHFNSGNAKEFSVNASDMSIVPETEWTLKGMYNSFAYIDEFFTALLNKAIDALEPEKESRYRSIGS